MKLYRAIILRGGWVVIPVLLFASLALGRKIPDLQIEAGANVLLNEDDPDLAFYNTSRPDWGTDEYAIFCVHRDDWFTPEAISHLRVLAADLSKVTHVRSVTSILDVPLLRQSDAPQGLFPSIAHLTDPGCNLVRAREELLQHTQAQGNLISADGRDLSFIVSLDVPSEVDRLDPIWFRLQGQKKTDPEAAAELVRLQPEYARAVEDLRVRRQAMVEGIRSIARDWETKLGEPVRLSGVPIVNINLVEHVTDDLNTFGIVSFALFSLAFFAIYRRLRWVALPVLTASLPVLLIVGCMVLLGMKMTVITSNLPVLLFVLMLPYTVYFVEYYRENRARDPQGDSADHTVRSAAAIWIPCLFSCTTTIAGFASLVTSGVSPIRHFGIMMSIGMACGLGIVFLLLPALNRFLPGLRVSPAAASGQPRGVARLLEQLTLRMPRWMLFSGAIALGLSAWGVTKIRVETKFIDYFRSTSEVYRGLEYIDTRLGGTTSLEIILTGPEKDFFKSARGMTVLDDAAKYFEAVPETGNLRSLKTLADELRKSWPKAKEKQLIGLLRTSAPDLVREFTDPDFRTSRIFIRMRETAPTLHRNNILRGLRAHLESLRGKPEWAGVEAQPTGVFLLYANMLNTLLHDQQETFLTVLGAIFAMLLLLFRSPVLAILVLLPQLLPAVFILGVMGWTGVPLDLVTVMITSIALGVGIDAAIQYAVRYRVELQIDGDPRAAITRSHATIGRAIWIATSIIVAGFLVFVLSKFIPSVYFGLFTALAMLAGQFSALTLLPALFLVTGHPRLRR